MAGQLQQDHAQIGWHEDGDWVWRVAFDAAQVAVPTLTHLRIPGGAPLLRAPGAFFAWPQINETVGRVTWKTPQVERMPDDGAVVRQRIDYLHPSGRRDLAEYRDLVFSEVGRNGKYTVDWTSHFTAGEAGAWLADAPEQCAGLHLPLDGGDEPLDFVEIPLVGRYDETVPPAGLVFAGGFGTQLYPSARHPGSIGVVADPRSTLGPHAWRADRDRREIVAALLGGEPVRLEPGEVWEVSYRVVVRPKQWDVADLRLELFRWLCR